MSKLKRILLAVFLPAVALFLMGQSTGPTVFTPRLTVSPGPLTVSTGLTTVQNLTILGTCTGCTTTSPGGSDTQVQFNNAGAFGGDAGLVYNSTNDVLTATGGVVATGGANVGNRFSASTQSPTSLSANTNDWALTPVPVVLITSSAAVNVTGISASTANADSFSLGNNVLLNLINTSANQITFTNEDSNSSAANRFTLPYGASYVIGTGESVQFYYNSGATRWQVANAKQISAQTNGTFGLDFNVGCTTTFSTGSHRYAKRGNDVWLTLIGGGTCTSNATTFTAAAGSLPAAITPDGTICTRLRGTDNGAAMEMLLCLNSTGSVTLSTCNANGACNAAGWTASGTKGFTGQNVTFAYNIDSNGTPSGGGN